MTDTATIDVAADELDYASIRTLVQEHIAYERSDIVLPPDWARMIASQAAEGSISIFVARIDGIPVGYAALTSDIATWTGERFGHLDCLFITEAHRGAGLGRVLIDVVASSAAARGYRELQWQTPEWNSAATRFYEKLGAAHLPKERFTLTV
ncbi:acetyltransferase (GNAT) family protein [Glaciihabitans tibetensis]|uniref:Acetyltransferase (GNAT) family protein n=1 Tax=Glaciihabitans tibetensis TaxID=1266600 RepID=A0A2T0VAH8_9MICO|nr:GNAT family N-acetyltransferase [Glaciihabitans tibetensis]PRY67161.1 acetyltransferase (GNAT) family protein [Glaciihabitans tibetensis]